VSVRAVTAGLLMGLLLVGCKVTEPLPHLGTVPEFALINQQGRAYGVQQLQGKVWIANFIFTRCPDICPLFTQHMRSVHDELSAASAPVVFVSFSVDPEYDTPDILQAYAKDQGALSQQWYFLTGPIEDVKQLVVQGLKMAMDKQPLPAAPDNVLHGSHFVLVDQNMQLRGYYSAKDPASRTQLVVDAQRLVK
jgi:protein SCO1/2